MTLEFTGKTTRPYVMINTAKFVMPDGSIVDIDRDTTEYSIDNNGILSMSWTDCYIWDGSSIQYIDEDFDGMFICFDLEDDADEEYKIFFAKCLTTGNVNQ